MTTGMMAGDSVAMLPSNFGAIAERVDRDGRILQRIDGVDAVLRGLCGHRIGNAHLRIEPEVRLHRGAGTERDVNAVGDVLLGQAELRGAHPIDIEVKIGSIDHLVHMDVDRAWNRGHTLTQAARDLVVGRIVTLHLHVDRRWQTEIEDLRHNIRGLKEEGEIGELLLQLRPQLLHIFLVGP